MNNERDNNDVEKAIGGGLLGLCLIFAIVIGGLLDLFLSSRWMSLAVFFIVGFGLDIILQRVRPSRRNAGKGWTRVYDFILTQMNLRKAFKRRQP